jgi:tetratricopeptide (TPR) repeat protein
VLRERAAEQSIQQAIQLFGSLAVSSLHHAVFEGGQIAHSAGDFAEAERRYRQSIQLANTLTPALDMGKLKMLGYAARRQGRTDEAAAMLRQSLDGHLEQYPRDTVGQATCLVGLAGVFSDRSQVETAIRLFAAAEGPLANFRRLYSYPADEYEYRQTLIELRQKLDAAAFAAAWAAGKALTWQQAIALVRQAT